MNRETFIKAAKILDMYDDCYIDFETKKHFIELNMDWEDGHPVWDEYDLHYTAFTADGKCYTDDEITPAIAKKAVFLEQSTGDGWLFYIGRNCPEDIIGDAFEASLGWLIDCKQELCEMPKECADALNALGFDVEAEEAEEETDSDSDSDAPASETTADESWFCSTDAPTDPDTANAEADTAALTRTAEDRLYHERAAQQAAQRAKRRGPLAFILTIFMIIILFIGGAATVAHALTTTAGALTAPATATGEEAMAKKIVTLTQPTAPAPTQPTTPAPTAPAPATATPATAPTQAPTAPTLAQLLARALEAQKTAQEAPQTPKETQTTKETLSLKTALKRALMAPKTGTTECVIYSALYASIRIEEVTTPAPEQPTETPEEAQEENKRVWTISQDTRRVAFMRELKNVARGRAYCEQITALLTAIDATDDDYIWKTAAFNGLPEDLKKMIKEKFEASECTDAERQECRAALDPAGERITLHKAAIETACETLARTAPEWAPLLYEEQPAPATLRQAILELQYCIFPIDSSPRARVFRGLEGIDFKTLSTPQDYIQACKAASLRAGEPSTAIPPEARARIMQWRSGTVTTSATVTSTAARLAQVWGMD